MIYAVEKVVVFEKLTGRVVSSGTTQMPERMVTDTLDVLLGASAVPNESYVQDGVVVPVIPKPSEFHVFDWNRKTWQVDTALAASLVRSKRSRLIQDSDWTQGRDISEWVAALWAPYRQSLRDVTTQRGFPLEVIWPIAPSN